MAVKWFKFVIHCQQSGDDQQENQSPSRKTSNNGQFSLTLIIVFVLHDLWPVLSTRRNSSYSWNKKQQRFINTKSRVILRIIRP